MSAEQQLKETLKEILVTAWERRQQEFGRRGEGEGMEEELVSESDGCEKGCRRFLYAGTDTGDARVGILSYEESQYKTTAEETGYPMTGGEGGAGPISELHNNK